MISLELWDAEVSIFCGRWSTELAIYIDGVINVNTLHVIVVPNTAGKIGRVSVYIAWL